MAQKRMFDRDIVSSDQFTEMSSDAQNLYFHLGVQADDEGFITPKGIMRLISAPEDSLKLLILKRFVIPFESGVVVITAWNQNNFLDKNRIKPTKHLKERALLVLTHDKTYEFNNGLTRVEESRVEEKRISGQSTVSLSKKKSSLSYLEEIPLEDLKDFVSRFDASANAIKSKAEDLLNYCRSKGRVYKDYSAFLLNALKKDFKPRRKMEIQIEEKLTAEQVQRNKEMLLKVGSVIKRM